MHTAGIYIGTKYIFSVAGTNPSMSFFMINGGYLEKLYNKQKDMQIHINKLSKLKLSDNKLTSLMEYYKLKTDNKNLNQQSFLLDYLKNEQQKLNDFIQDILQVSITKLISILSDMGYKNLIVVLKKEKQYEITDINIKWIISMMEFIAKKESVNISFRHEWFCPIISPFDQIVNIDEKKAKRMTRHIGYFKDYMTNELFPLDTVIAYNIIRVQLQQNKIFGENDLIYKLKHPVKFEIYGFYKAKTETIKERIIEQKTVVY